MESGNPVTLPLYPGDCKIPSDSQAEDRVQELENNISTETRENGKLNFEEKTEKSTTPFRDALSFFNIPWRNDKENDVIDDTESSRAFNTRTIKVTDHNGEGISVKEIVEPILKPQSTKNARSHDPNKEKGEITEPILGPTRAKNVRSVGTKISETDKNRRDIDYSVQDSKGVGSEWVPKEIPVRAKTERKLAQNKKERVHEDPGNPLEQIATTVQFIPNRLARMFEQAEKYTRETILPLVSTYTPRFISDIITPKDEKKYVPLNYEEPLSTAMVQDSSKKLIEARGLQINPISLPTSDESSELTTPYSHIQRIRKKSEVPKIELLQESASSHVSTIVRSTTAKMNISIKSKGDTTTKKSKEKENVSILPTKKNPKAIYINLPVFETDEQKIKYIPLSN